MAPLHPCDAECLSPQRDGGNQVSTADFGMSPPSIRVSLITNRPLRPAKMLYAIHNLPIRYIACSSQLE